MAKENMFGDKSRDPYKVFEFIHYDWNLYNFNHIEDFETEDEAQAYVDEHNSKKAGNPFMVMKVIPKKSEEMK